MKAAHFSDLHYGHTHTAWIDQAFEDAIESAIDDDCEVAVLSGDSFDASIQLHNPAVHLLIARVRRLAEVMPVLILQGTFSHDRPGCLDVFKAIGTEHPVYVADETQAVAYGTYGWLPISDADALDWLAIRSRDTRAVFYAIPSLNPAELKANDSSAKIGDSIRALCEHWAPLSLAARGMGIPTVLVSHGTVNGCVTESRNAMVSQDHEFGTATLFSAEASAVMLGHIHKHQSWERDGRRIAYPGSICKLVYGHSGGTGWLCWDVRADRADFSLRDVPCRKLIELAYDGAPDMADIAAKLAEMPGAFVRLRYQLDEEHRASVDAASLKEMLLAAGAAEVKVEGRINPVVRSRAAGIAEKSSLPEKVEKWCELTNTPAGPLLARLAMLEAGQQPGARA